MTATAPIAIELVENAIHDWVVAATGIPGERVCFPEKRDDGAPDVALPAALIQVATSLVPLSQPEVRTIPSIVKQQITILVDGPGTFAVLLYVGFDFDSPLTFSYDSPDQGLDPQETPDISAAALFAIIDAGLPAGITAAIDGDDPTSIIVTGSTDEPLFALAPSDADLVEITPLVERFPELEVEWSRMVCRVTFRGVEVRGFATGFDLMTRARKAMHRVLKPKLQAAGWNLAGILLAQNTTLADRSETQGTLDFALLGYATAAYQVPAARRIGHALNVA
jgi:hypothetical protein